MSAPKPSTRRTATASAFVVFSAAVLEVLPTNPKGNPLEVARFAGMQGGQAYLRSDSHVSSPRAYACGCANGDRGRRRAHYPRPPPRLALTGVEMEALTAAAVGPPLTVYDIDQGTGDKAIVIRNVQLEQKSGGKEAVIFQGIAIAHDLHRSFLRERVATFIWKAARDDCS